MPDYLSDEEKAFWAKEVDNGGLVNGFIIKRLLAELADVKERCDRAETKFAQALVEGGALRTELTDKTRECQRLEGDVFKYRNWFEEESRGNELLQNEQDKLKAERERLADENRQLRDFVELVARTKPFVTKPFVISGIDMRQRARDLLRRSLMSDYLSDEEKARLLKTISVFEKAAVERLLAELTDTKAKLAEAERALEHIAETPTHGITCIEWAAFARAALARLRAKC